MSGSATRPRISVVIPCYDDGELVVDAAASVRESEPVEVLVVDDGSRDSATQAVLTELESPCSVLRHPENRGLIAARATGLEAAAGRFLFNLDADDLVPAGVLAQMADRLEATPDAAVCFGDYEEFGTRQLLRAVPSGLDPFRLAYTNEYPVSAMFRREVLLELGGWGSAGYSAAAYEDWNLWITLCERGCGAIHFGPARTTFRRRLHGERMLTGAKRRHPEIYRELQAAHPQFFARVKEHRRNSPISTPRKLLYPIIYGGRRRFPAEARVKDWLDRTGVWTLRR